MGHVVRDGSRTTANYESDDPEMLADVALATAIALIQQNCGRPLFAVEVRLTKDLHAIGARVIPEMLRNGELVVGTTDRTCDPYHVKVGRDANSRVKSKRKGRLKCKSEHARSWNEADLLLTCC
jgi:hypothetical protein